jgi:hypothetical protein
MIEYYNTKKCQNADSMKIKSFRISITSIKTNLQSPGRRRHNSQPPRMRAATVSAWSNNKKQTYKVLDGGVTTAQNESGHSVGME